MKYSSVTWCKYTLENLGNEDSYKNRQGTVVRKLLGKCKSFKLLPLCVNCSSVAVVAGILRPWNLTLILLFSSIKDTWSLYWSKRQFSLEENYQFLIEGLSRKEFLIGKLKFLSWIWLVSGELKVSPEERDRALLLALSFWSVCSHLK